MSRRQIVVSAGDAITAKLVEQAGFDGIWISGFEVCSRMGIPDNGSLTMTEMLNVAKLIVDAVSIPVWVDVDTGYGNFKRTVSEFEKIGVAGVCVEDIHEGVKTNSLWGGPLPLMDMEEYGKKISVRRNGLKIIARTEAMIRGHGKAEALKRILHYHKCGAEYVLPHVRKASDILTYPTLDMVIVPTKFPNYTNEDFFDMGYSMVIWANQTERVKIKAIRECLGSIKGSDCAEYVEAHLSVDLEDMKGLTPDD